MPRIFADTGAQAVVEIADEYSTTNTLLGKHNVASNQADWQFGSLQILEAFVCRCDCQAGVHHKRLPFPLPTRFPWQPLVHYLV